MSESQGQGISRRDLLKRGAALGGAVVWATPVVQTLGMGRAFAQDTSPVGGKDISYIAINVDCGENQFFIKWEDGGWDGDPGRAPDCADKNTLFGGADGGSLGFGVSLLNESCAELSIPEIYRSCELTIWVKAGSSKSTAEPCNTVTSTGEEKVVVCTAPPS